MTTLYHETRPENVDAILRDGFRDGEPELLLRGRRGVWFRDISIRTRNDLVLLAIDTDVSEAELRTYERDRRGARDFREFFIPAARLMNRRPHRV